MAGSLEPCLSALLAGAGGVEQVVRLAEIVVPREDVSEIAADPGDNRVLEAGAEGRTNVTVSGDRHLLAVGSWRGILIHTPAEILAKIDER